MLTARSPVLLALLLLAGACSHRIPVAQTRFQTSISDQRERIRVYPHRRVVVTYDAIRDRGTDVDNDLFVRDRKHVLHTILKRRTRGKIVDIHNWHGARVLWVSFRDDCQTFTCAFAFVARDDGQFYLARVPSRPTYRLDRVSARHHGRRRQLALGPVAHLSEPNPVYRTTHAKLPVLVRLDLIEHRKRPRHVHVPLPGASPYRSAHKP